MILDRTYKIDKYAAVAVKLQKHTVIHYVKHYTANKERCLLQKKSSLKRFSIVLYNVVRLTVDSLKKKIKISAVEPDIFLILCFLPCQNLAPIIHSAPRLDSLDYTDSGV